MSSIVKFNEFQSQPETLSFLVLQSDQLNDENIFCLTPVVMQWDESTAILNLKSCQNYWCQQAVKSDRSYLDWLQEVLLSHRIDSFQAIMCHHPWQGLISLSESEEGCSFSALDSAVGKKRLGHVYWSRWLSPFPQLLRHFTSIKMPQKEFHGQCQQLQHFLQRMQLTELKELKSADSSAMKKRFGKTIGMAWDWTFPESNPGTLWDQMQDLAGFPWIDFKPQQNPLTTRHLEYPVGQWQEIEPLLKEDLAQLQEASLPHHKYFRINWDLVLYDMQKITLPVLFRTPYSLSDEAPDFSAALQQAAFSFQRFHLEMTQKGRNFDLPEHMPIVAWDLEIEDSIYFSARTVSMIDYHEDLQKKRIEQMQNKISISLENYKLEPHFLPLQGLKSSLGVEAKASEQNSSSKQNHVTAGEIGSVVVTESGAEKKMSQAVWAHASLRRPFFLHPSELLIESPQIDRNICQGGRMRFLETVARPWWEQEPLSVDFYQITRGRNRYWVGCQQGQWIEYGLFD